MYYVSGLCAEFFRRDLPALLSGMFHVETRKELVKKFLSFFACLSRLLQRGKAAEVAGPALEGDLCAPFAAAFCFVDAADAAGIVFGDPSAADILHAGPFNKMLGSKGSIAAAAAGGMTAHETGLTDACLFPAAAAALPVVFFIAFSIVSYDRQFPELFSDPVLERRTAQTTAAAAVAVYQLTCRSSDFVPAVAHTVPLYTAVNVPFRCDRKDLQFPVTFSSQIFIAGLLFLASAGSHPAVFKKAGRRVHSITAITPAKPDRIAVFSLICRFESSQLSKPHPCKIHLFAHCFLPVF